MNSRVVNNVGAGILELTFNNLSTTVAAFLARPITQADLDAGRNVVRICGNHYVGHCTTTHRIDGKAVAVSTKLTAKGVPDTVVVQVRGVMTLNGTTTIPDTTDSCAGRGGKVVGVSPTTVRALGGTRCPTVLNVWNTDSVDVLL
jgi:hypothetical protein